MESANELSNTSQSNDASAAPVETRVGQAVELESQLTEPEKMRSANKLSDEQEAFLKDWYDYEKTRDDLQLGIATGDGEVPECWTEIHEPITALSADFPFV